MITNLSNPALSKYANLTGEAATTVALRGAPLTNAPSPTNIPEPNVANFIIFGPLNTSTCPWTIINILSPLSPSFIIVVP